MPVPPDPTRPAPITPAVIKEAARVDESYMPDMVYVLRRPTSTPGPLEITGKYIARIRGGVNARELTDPVLARIANRVAYTCIMPRSALDTLRLSSTVRLFIKDLTKEPPADRVVDNCEVVSIDPGGTWGWRCTMICIEPA